MSDLVRLEFANGNICSGFFFKPNKVMTAAHCFVINGQVKLNQRITFHTKKQLNILPIQAIIHPLYEKDLSQKSHDLAIIETTAYKNFNEEYRLSNNPLSVSGKVIYYGAGRTQVTKKNYETRRGNAHYLKMGTSLYMTDISKTRSGVAPNDSGGPVLDFKTLKVIALITKGSASLNLPDWLPTIGVSISLAEEENWNFILPHLDHSQE